MVLTVTEPSLTSLKDLENYLPEELTDGNVGRVMKGDRWKNYRMNDYFIFGLLQIFDKKAPKVRE